MVDLERKVAIVTGGANGIGQEICLKLAKKGINIAIADIDTQNADKVVQEIIALGCKAISINTDVTKMDSAEQMAKVTLSEFGQIDILINDAGGAARERAALFHESTEEVWDFVIDRNLRGVRNCSRAVINHMMQRRTGKIVSLASIAGVIGSLKQVDYSSAKAGIIGFTMALAKEVAAYGINVNCVSPAIAATKNVLAQNPPEFIERIKKPILMGRLAEPGEIADVVVFLTSDEASFITGQNIIIDGGRVLGA